MSQFYYCIVNIANEYYGKLQHCKKVVMASGGDNFRIKKTQNTLNIHFHYSYFLSREIGF